MIWDIEVRIFRKKGWPFIYYDRIEAETVQEVFTKVQAKVAEDSIDYSDITSVGCYFNSHQS